MYKIRTLNSISESGLNILPKENFIISNQMDNPDGIILRSFDMHQMEIPKSLFAISRAGAGTNNIPIDECSKRGIVVFNTPGANANAVKELVLTSILISSRKIVSGIEWVKTLKEEKNIEKEVEAGKKAFVGPEIFGKTLGVIGLGAIGVEVANAAENLGMNVIGYDPFLSIDAAWHLSSSVKKAGSIEDIVKNSDYITIHVPLNENTKGIYNEQLVKVTKRGARLLNLARGELVDLEALKFALENEIISCYVTDFPNEEVLKLKNVIAMPHIGASTPESEENCAIMAANEIKEFLEYGNIKNSVNFPNCTIPYTGRTRVSIAHKNMPNMIGPITTAFAKHKINIDNMINKSKGAWAYTLIVTDDFTQQQKMEAQVLIKDLRDIDGVANARIIEAVKR